MGKGGGGKIKSDPVTAEEPVTPAVARDAETTELSQGNQARRLAQLRGIRSTYSRFAERQGAANGTREKLG